MFERYMGAKQEKPNKWVNLTITVSVVVHTIGFTALLIYSFWKIDKLPVKDTSVLYMAAQMATPPPPPPPPPPPKKSSVKTHTDVKKSTEVVQPTKDQPKPQEDKSDDDGEDNGVEGGVKGGQVGGVIGGEIGGTLGGEIGGAGAAPPPPPPTNVAQAMLEGQRIAGDAHINLSDPNLIMLRNQGVAKMTVKAQMCLDAGGNPRSVDFKQSSGYPEIDTRIRGEMNKWKYRPYVVAGKTVPVCFIVIFNYKIQ